MIVIPAIDIMGGKCVRLTRGDFDTRIVYDANPLEQAKIFEDNGFRYLHIVDLDGAKTGKMINFKTVESIARQTNLKIDFGGGIKSKGDVEMALSLGASQLCIGSIAVSDPLLFLNWIENFGADKFILSADVLKRKIKSNGWQQDTETDIIDFIKQYAVNGLKQVMCTDISKDGMLQGPSINLYKEILSTTTIGLIASGGVSSLQDLITLQDIGCDAAVVGKAIYENRVSLTELAAYA